MNRRKFLAIISYVASLFAVPSWLRARPAAPPYPVPASSLTPQMVREFWRQKRGPKPLKAWVVVDLFTLDNLQRLPLVQHFNGITFHRANVLFARFDVVNGRRVDIPWLVLKGRWWVENIEWYTAPFQDYPVYEGDSPIGTISARRVLPDDLSSTILDEARICLEAERYDRSLASSMEPLHHESIAERAGRAFPHLTDFVPPC